MNKTRLALVRTYYDLLGVKPTASPLRIETAFRRYVIRYRVTTPVEQIASSDAKFTAVLNAYLTLQAPFRAAYDARVAEAGQDPSPTPAPWGQLSAAERQTLLARLACWRRETSDAVHLLRTTLNRQPDHAPGWALLGEIYFSIDRLDEGIEAYERATLNDPETPAYATRLQEAIDARAQDRELPLEPSPEEALQREERQRRLRGMLALGLPALAILVYALLRPLHPDPEALNLPWRAIAFLCLGVFLLLLALAHGRYLQSFEQAMVWSSMQAASRLGRRSYPYGMLIGTLAIPSLWLATAAVVSIALLDEEWPLSAVILIGVCAIPTIILTVLMHALSPDYWWTTLVFSGNLPLLAGMLGWWIGSAGEPV